MTKLATPTNFVVSSRLETSVLVGWKNVTGNNGYSIRKGTTGAWTSIAKDTVTYTGSSLEAADTFTYYLKAVGDNLTTSDSDPVTLVVPAFPSSI